MDSHKKNSKNAIENLPSDEIDRMNYYIEKIRAINLEKFNKTGQMPLAACITFGCQMNARDSEMLNGLLTQMGYGQAASEKDADLILHNTCCVRENAENKVYGNLGFLKNAKKNKKDLKIVLCGCMMQQETVIDKIKQAYRQVDIIFGTFNLHRFPQLLYTNMETGQMIIDVWKEHSEIVEDLPVIREYSHKASVNIMYGCNNFCSYCIVPYVRGRERSRSVEEITNEIKEAVLSGAKEIMLLGQNVNSYLSGFEESKINFPKLLKIINQIEGVERIRFMTSHPKDLSDELIYAIRDLDKVCKQLHLPLQSGSTAVLAKMNRKYTKDSYLELTEKVKREIPGIAITTDIIVGFPGETEQDFEDSLEVIRKVRFSGAFTFIYSKRTGTPAANMENIVPEEVIKERFGRLLGELNPIIYETNRSFLGNTVKVLADGYSASDSEYISARTDSNAIVHFKGDGALIGHFVNVKITECKTFYLTGELIGGE